MDMKEFSSILQQNGVVGAGGAGFPTYAKLDQRANTILLNCAECEPLLRLHRQLLEKYAYEIMDTFHKLGEAVGAGEVVIGIKKAYTKTIDALNAHIGAFQNMRLALLDEVYPAGDEVVLIYEATGKQVRPGGLPIESGVAVFNVETIYNLYCAMTQQKPVMDKLVSVVAEVNHPITVRVPIGCTVDECVALAGGARISDPVYFMGGPMMGSIVSGQAVITKTSNAILVLPKNHLIIQKKQQNAQVNLARAASSCCQCEMCTDLCPRHALGHPIEPHKFMRAATCKDVQDPNIFVNTLFCSSCGLCEMYSCMQGLSPRTLMAEYKNGLRAAGVRPPQGVVPAAVKPSREMRKVPMARLMARLDLTKYNVAAPLDESRVSVNRVKIMLRQHIGAPAVPAVSTGDLVTAGQVIANPGNGLSVAIHASIDGVVTEANSNFVIIDAKK